MRDFPTARLTSRGEPAAGGHYVLYWMTTARRLRSSWALQRAVDWAVELRQPLLVLEALRAGYPWASDRLHAFVVQGMADHHARLQGTAVHYYPYLEPRAGEGKGLLRTLAERASVVVGDEFPAFFLPRMVAAASAQVRCRFELVDGNGLLPLRATAKEFPTAHAFRRHLQRFLPAELLAAPRPNPLARVRLPPCPPPPAAVLRRWPPFDLARVENGAWLAALPIDHAVGPAPQRGGSVAAGAVLRTFIARGLSRYGERNHPDREVCSHLSPYLHFGHLGAHEVFAAVAKAESWDPTRLSPRADGRRAGWWGMSPGAEAFLDQVCTWRELGYVFAHHRADHDRYESLPGWALTTLERHAVDPREVIYDLETFEEARTHDAVWNAAQRQLRAEGRIHNYLRMLWGKKILEWTPHPRVALEIMVHLNNKYALDGRDPNSYAGIFWVLGRFDRPWGPERAVYGKVRYMSSDNTRRKLAVSRYLERWGGQADRNVATAATASSMIMVPP